jgi:hypothetical protein
MALGKSGLVDFFEEVVTRNTALERFDQILGARKRFGGRAFVVVTESTMRHPPRRPADSPS